MRLLALLALTVVLPTGTGASSPDDFHMTVQDVFAITGRGIVATGTVEGGPVRVDDVVCLRPTEGESRELTVEGIESFREVLEVAEPGTPVGLLFSGIEPSDMARGDRLTASC